MDTRPGSLARALVNLVDGIVEQFQSLSRGLSDWSGFPVDVCYFVMFILLPAAYILGWVTVAAIADAILKAAGAFFKSVAKGYLRRHSAIRPGLRVRKP